MGLLWFPTPVLLRWFGYKAIYERVHQFFAFQAQLQVMEQGVHRMGLGAVPMIGMQTRGNHEGVYTGGTYKNTGMTRTKKNAGVRAERPCLSRKAPWGITGPVC